MIWIGLILGAIFGWAGLIAALCLWAIVSVAKLFYYVAVFAAQLIIAALVLLGHLLAWAYRAITGAGRRTNKEHRA